MTKEKTKERGERWGLHMQDPKIRETLFELSMSLNRSNKSKKSHSKHKKTQKES